jgi:hypothetical protein
MLIYNAFILLIFDFAVGIFCCIFTDQSSNLVKNLDELYIQNEIHLIFKFL